MLICRVEMEDSHLDLNVYLISVQFESISKRENYEFNFLRHFRSLSGSTVKELPVVRSDNVYQRRKNDYYRYYKISL